MPFNVRLNKPKKSGSSFLLCDQFKAARAAGSVDGTRAEPGPGTRRVTDAGSALAVRDGYLQTTVTRRRRAGETRTAGSPRQA